MLRPVAKSNSNDDVADGNRAGEGCSLLFLN